jgi:phage terminase small subunit
VPRGVAIRDYHRTPPPSKQKRHPKTCCEAWVTRKEMPTKDDSMKSARAPSHLTPQSRALWNSIQRDYELRDDELRLLDLALTALDRAVEAGKRLDSEGLTLPGRAGDRVHPLVSVERSASLTAAKLLRQLGLSDDDVVAPALPKVWHAS